MIPWDTIEVDMQESTILDTQQMIPIKEATTQDGYSQYIAAYINYTIL